MDSLPFPNTSLSDASTAADEGGPSAFHPFHKLPAELRLMIYDHLCGPTVVCAKIRDQKFVCFQSPVDGFRHTCYEMDQFFVDKQSIDAMRPTAFMPDNPPELLFPSDTIKTLYVQGRYGGRFPEGGLNVDTLSELFPGLEMVHILVDPFRGPRVSAGNFMKADEHVLTYATRRAMNNTPRFRAVRLLFAIALRYYPDTETSSRPHMESNVVHFVFRPAQ
ncbi:hypothetical protein VTK73DRAFT_326 [Phialemonium thermophilum]|uniref:2EXR domain-containing protein n=1 Tax=Phialemonium thermophilum TaxID=223376 RepID=A0ABR3VVP9_9PEZI